MTNNIFLRSNLSCPLPHDLQPPSDENAGDSSSSLISCIFPRNRMALAFVIVDALIVLLLPAISFFLYAEFWKRDFYTALFRAQYLVGKHAKVRFSFSNI